MMDIDVTMDGDELDEMRDAAIQDIGARIRDIADRILSISQDRVPVRKGTLKKSGSCIHGQGYSFVGYGTPYARPVHDGFDAHVQHVRAHDRRLDGVVVRVRAHERNMPARTGRPYLDDAIDMVREELGEDGMVGIEIIRVTR